VNIEDLQSAWQIQKPAPKVTIASDLLLTEVRRNAEQFHSTIFWRDVREVAAAFLLAAWFLYDAFRKHDWTDYVSAFICLGVGLFMVIDRSRQNGQYRTVSDSLKKCLESSLAAVNHQIWLLKNVFWWYLLPLGSGLVLSLLSSASRSKHGVLWMAVELSISMVVCALIYWGIYWLNQLAVRKNLEPRRRELENLLKQLE
jgi:hypothetical protein